jgi:hypothetical protein
VPCIGNTARTISSRAIAGFPCKVLQKWGCPYDRGLCPDHSTLAILDAVRARPMRHLMINITGVRIAPDRICAHAGEAPEDLEREALSTSNRLDTKLARSWATRLSGAACGRVTFRPVEDAGGTENLRARPHRAFPNERLRCPRIWYFRRQTMIALPCNPRLNWLSSGRTGPASACDGTLGIVAKGRL